MLHYMEQRNSKCEITYTHCENCGRQVDPWMCEDGYTQCCNELVGYPGECRNHHGEDDIEYPPAPLVRSEKLMADADAVLAAKKLSKECSVSGCSNKKDRRGLCRKHANEAQS